MQHLLHKKHHPHLKKRSILECIGLFALLLFTFSQRDIVLEAIETVADVHAGWFVLLLGMYWVMLPIASLNFKLISPKPKRVKLPTTILAHLAGAGPGRIIPGGIGNMSITSLHLKKTGLSIEQSVAVVVINNAIGVSLNTIALVFMFIFIPEIHEIVSLSVSLPVLLALFVALGIVAVALQWIHHLHGIQKEIKKVLGFINSNTRRLLSQPSRLCSIFLVSIISLAIHVAMLDFSAFALGVHLSISDALVALSVGVIVGGVLPTPGGIGGVEAGITAALVALGYDATSATSIAVLTRVATYWQPLIPGTLAYFYLRERKLL